MTNNDFINEIKKLGIQLSEEQLKQLNRYYELLIEWNKVMNLTGITLKEDVYLKHFYDSLTIKKASDFDKEITVCDIGTGAGFPGMVLKIVFPKLKVTLIDSLNKRINFLNKVIEELNLKNIITIHERIEEYGVKNREKFDIVTARAVAPLNVLLEYCIPIVKNKGFFIPMKANASEEIENSKSSLKLLKSEIIEIIEFKLPIENSNRTIIKIQKKEITNKLYPRKQIEIKKNPL